MAFLVLLKLACVHEAVISAGTSLDIIHIPLTVRSMSNTELCRGFFQQGIDFRFSWK